MKAMQERSGRKAVPQAPVKQIRADINGPPVVQHLAKLPAVGPLIRDGYRRWYRARYLRAYRPQMDNARRLHQSARPELTTMQQRVLNDLRHAGYAWATFAEIWPHVEFDRIRRDALQWSTSPEVRAHEEAYRAGATVRWKEYLVRRYDRGAVVAATDPYLGLGLSRDVLAIVNEYIGLAARLTYFDVWNTVARVHDGPALGSQRWHRDPEDSQLVKVFLYLSDVDAEAGAMEYVAHSRRHERYGRLWPQEFPGGSVPPKDDLEHAIRPEDRVVCAASAGSVLFADTTGFHRGGRATTRNRLSAVWTYVTPQSIWPRAFNLSGMPEGLTPEQHFAVAD